MAKDTLSAVLDGECSSDELDRFLEELDRNPALMGEWSRHCLARDAAEGVRVQPASACICGDVMAQLGPMAAPARAKVIPLFRERVRSYWKPAIGLAAAASFGAIAVSLNVAEQVPTAAPSAVSVPMSGTTVSMPVSGNRQGRLLTVSASPEDLERAAREADLRNYLIEHSSAVTDRGMGATLSYARFAAHSEDTATMTQPASLEVLP